ncbi:hypothetical protein HK101_005558 [Irineochytrium annulatum]|nr:hypothetical protein HK101_005558 [Irineochytrium annulatum]
MPDVTTKITLRSRRTRESCLAKDGKLASTFQSSFMPHDVKASREAERGEYVKNKGKAGKGGEWWGHVEDKFDTKSCYRESFKEHNYKVIRVSSLEVPTAGKGQLNRLSDEEQFRRQWFQYRMKKPPADDIGKHYDILTGKEMVRAPTGVFQPGRSAGRVSIDKMNSENGRYNIISNALIVDK